MITAMIKFVVPGMLAATLFASPGLAAGGGGGGGGGASSTDPYAGAYSDQKAQPAYPKRSSPKATQKGKKPNNQSRIGDPPHSRPAIVWPMTRSTSATTTQLRSSS
ncbi:hypothetical protein ACVWW2_001576 [Bradyrhizobium sp. LM4.3]